jgi:hypothetical protein
MAMHVQNLFREIGDLLERRENPYDGVLALVTLWNRLLRHCQTDLFKSVTQISHEALAIAALDDDNEQERKHARAALHELLVKIKPVARFLYATYQDGRHRLKALAKFWKAKSPELEVSVPPPLSKLDTADLVTQVHEGAAAWLMDLRRLTKQGHALVLEYSKAALHENLSPKERAQLISNGISWHNDFARFVFARMYGLFIRIEELIRREQDPHFHLDWEFPWKHDEELGNRESI